MEIYITTTDCKINNNHGLLPSVGEVDKIIENLNTIKLMVLNENIDTVKYNKNMLEKSYENVNVELAQTNKEGYIYLIECRGRFKIGRTINIETRKKKYITENPDLITMICSYKVEDYIVEENRLHEKFKSKRHRKEWFNLTKKDVTYIKTLCNTTYI